MAVVDNVGWASCTTDLSMAIVKGGTDELLEARGVEGGDKGTVGGGDELVPGASGCSSGEAVVEEG